MCTRITLSPSLSRGLKELNTKKGRGRSLPVTIEPPKTRYHHRSLSVTKADPPQKIAQVAQNALRTRKNTQPLSSVVKIGRNFQKPLATAKVELQSIIRRQFEDDSKDDVSLSEPDLTAYLADMKNHGIRPNLSICKINANIGNGIFLKPDAASLPSDTFIGIYSGEMRIRHDQDLSENIDYAFTILTNVELIKGEIELIEGASEMESNSFNLEVDGTKTGNFSRYLNHAGADDANIEHRYIRMEDGSIQIGLWTKKTIEPGEQLLYDYKDDYWESKRIDPTPVTPKTYQLSLDGQIVQNRSGRNK